MGKPTGIATFPVESTSSRFIGRSEDPLLLLIPSSRRRRSSPTTTTARACVIRSAHSLCWSLALYRAGNEIGAAKKLRQAMLSNLYLVPYLLGEPISEIDMWHRSNAAEPAHVNRIPDPYLQLWTDEEKQWAGRLYDSPGFRSARERYIEISKLLDGMRPGPERSRLVREMHELERG